MKLIFIEAMKEMKEEQLSVYSLVYRRVSIASRRNLFRAT